MSPSLQTDRQWRMFLLRFRQPELGRSRWVQTKLTMSVSRATRDTCPVNPGRIWTLILVMPGFEVRLVVSGHLGNETPHTGCDGSRPADPLDRLARRQVPWEVIFETV